MAAAVTYTNFGGLLVHENRAGVETQYVNDTLGSLVECRNTGGTKTYEATYWPYGEIRTSSGTNPSQWAFVGLLGYLRETAARTYVRARYYRQELARWMTVDPLWPSEGAYSYVDQMPVEKGDPLGLQTFDPFEKYKDDWRRWFDDIKPKGGGDPGDFLKSCAPVLGLFVPCFGCGMGLYGQWGNDHPIHVCNAKYAHCMLCCTIAGCYDNGVDCALTMQALQMGTGGRANDPGDRQLDRVIPCIAGTVIGLQLKGKSGKVRHAGCHSACAKRYPLDGCPPSSRFGYPYSDIKEVCSPCA